MMNLILKTEGNNLNTYQPCDASLEQLKSDFPSSNGWLIVELADLPADFSVDTYTIKAGKLIKASAKVIAERKAAKQAVQNAIEVERLKTYLTSTDWAVVKCAELGVPLSELYPSVAAERITARVRINEIEPA